ncbi:N-acetylglucosamine kinase-like BadF-type ATPase [Agromyces terreus]|uniref:N-acetylglucosamine kinase-like BadF-type ATPase n=1 Tax=Agromyces terreus TaxID=424795 RepID=A0A9X2H3N9_9MICO|nr:BadF/BadG/BcrA/BcrD ATPase family protein [Agromyces terreus]MCP2369484.1 N-acetylglucosamine kinase-like BadF-type ATPase [Agromyces terreus]
MSPARDAVVVAVDGGGSKTDAVALTLDGRVVAHRRAGGSSPQLEGLTASVAVIDELVTEVAAGREVVQIDLYLSGLDLPIEIERFREAIGWLSWASASAVVENDLFALLRAGTDAADAVAVVCGTGVNAVGRRADGATARFPSLGGISGDWGGGYGLGEQALWFAARDLDGRGAPTALTAAIPGHLGAASLSELIEDLHFRRRPMAELSRLAPVVFEAAGAGDAVAGALVDRQADEILAFARACLTRLDLLDRAVPIVLGGGIVRSGDPRMLARIETGLASIAHAATLEFFASAPIIGAALLALEAGGAGPDALLLARDEVAAATSASVPVGG